MNDTRNEQRRFRAAFREQGLSATPPTESKSTNRFNTTWHHVGVEVEELNRTIGEL